MIIQGTTPPITFDVGDFDFSTLAEIEITFSQKQQVLFQKLTADCTIDGTKITARLTQEETLAVNPLFPLAVQLRLMDNDGIVYSHIPIEEGVGRCLSGKVMEITLA